MEKYMFTVIICDKSIIDDYKLNYGIYLRPLVGSSEVAFCEWETDGKTLDEAVPGLGAAIAQKNDWQALIILSREIIGSDEIKKRNPFDYVNSRKPKKLATRSDVEAYRSYTDSVYEKALGNPLTRLSIWLAGIPIKVKPTLPEIYGDMPDVSESKYFDELEYREIDPLKYETDLARVKKFDLLSEHFDVSGAIFNLPKHIVAVAERVSSDGLSSQAGLWKVYNEFDYSRFYEDNLYPDKMRYLLFDISYIGLQRNEQAYFNFLLSTLTIAVKGLPNDAARPNRVYRIVTSADNSRMSAACGRYIRKLSATYSKISGIIEKTAAKPKPSVTNLEARKLFESESEIPVEINSEYNTEDLMAEYDIGMSKDCPSDEEAYWDDQFHRISKLFIRFLREPRRAVKTAVTGDFRAENYVDDPKALALNEFQQEDVLYKLQDEEQLMVDTETENLFDSDSYTKRMEKADKELKQRISQRMTRKKTLLIGLAAIAAFFFGFIPFFIENRGLGTLMMQILTALSATAAFALVGFVCLLVLKRRLVKCFKNFNSVMSGIIADIYSGLKRYSTYLSHTCNVMREFSVINYIGGNDTEDSLKCKIMTNHLLEIEHRIDDVARLFSAKQSDISGAPEEPYDYDYSVLADYDYPVPFAASETEIEYIQSGNTVSLPVDYLKSIILEREELYE